MESFLGLLFLGGIIWLIVYCVKKNKQEKIKKQEETEQKVKEEREKALKELKEKWDLKKKEFLDNGLPTLDNTTLNLTKNEKCHFMGDAFFCKIKQETVGYQGGSRGVSIRVMKGMSFRVGNHRGHYIKQDVTEKTNGTIYLTSKKIVFSALKNSSVIKYENIVSLDTMDNRLQIQTEKKTYLFEIVDSFNFLLILECILNEATDIDS